MTLVIIVHDRNLSMGSIKKKKKKKDAYQFTSAHSCGNFIESENFAFTAHPHYNAPHYNAVFNIAQSW